MRPTTPLLGITVLVGMAGGIAVTGSLTVLLAPGLPGSAFVLFRWLAFALAALGGIASFFHMHRLAAARFILRRLRTSWLSREALTTGLFAGLLGVLALAPLVISVSAPWERIGFLVAAGLGLVAMVVTAMIYATIPAMRSWHSPLTVVAMVGVGLVSGWGAVVAVLAEVGSSPAVLAGERDALLAALALLLAVKALQIRQFADARTWLRAATGTGLPRGPYRLQDTGTTRPPYRTQTQVWPPLTPYARRRGYGLLFVTLGILPMAAFAGSLAIHLPHLVLAGAVLLMVGAFVERWMFFADATHSSLVWFQDEAWLPSRVATPVRSHRPQAGVGAEPRDAQGTRIDG